MRKAIVAGQFYPEKREELKREIEKMLSSLDVSSQAKQDINAGIVPHAGYIYSGKCASYVYSLLKNTEVDSVIILGTNHSGLGENICFSVEDFETPLGVSEIDIELVEDILIQLKKTQIKVGANDEAHKYEHSIEVQIPFIQTCGKNAKIVPVLVKDLSIKEIEKAGHIFSSIIKEQEKAGKRVFILASSDFTHYGRAYNFLPFTDNVKNNLYQLDNDAINSALKLDVEEFYGKARKTTICGGNPVSLLLQIAKNLKLQAKKLCYYASGDISNKWDNVVGYASIVFI